MNLCLKNINFFLNKKQFLINKIKLIKNSSHLIPMALIESLSSAKFLLQNYRNTTSKDPKINYKAS